MCITFDASARLSARLSYNKGDGSGHIAYEIRICYIYTYVFRFELAQTI
jgi:hypothetical protein